MGNIDTPVHVLLQLNGDRARGGPMPTVPGGGDRPSPRRQVYLAHFIWVYFVILLGTILNFFLTENPYRAIHNVWFGVGNESLFFLSPRINGIAFSLYLLLFRYVNLDYRILAICSLCIVSGLVTRRIETRFLTYGLLVVSLLGTSSLGRHDSGLSFAKSRIMGALSRINLAVWLSGLATLVLLPQTSGFLHFVVSREIRGEVTLWYMTGVYAIFSSICVVNILSNRKYLRYFWIGMLSLHILTTFLTARRVWIMQSLIPVMLGVAFSRTSLLKLSMIFAAGGLCLVGFYAGLLDRFIELFFLATSGSQISFADASNGRADLWQYHLECFLRSPIWGNGAFLLDYNRDKESLDFLKTDYEIGVLSVFSEYGALFGLAIVAVSLVALLRAFKIVKSTMCSGENAFVSFLAFFYTTNYGLFLVETNNRPDTLEGFIFWYAMMFLFYRNPRSSIGHEGGECPSGLRL